MKIRRSRPGDQERLLDIWLRSVRATHDFLTERDIVELTPVVRDHVLPNLDLWILCGDDVEPIGFLGMGVGSIEALFIDPENTRRGGGKMLVSHARTLTGRLRVDVNEQNCHAIHFYQAIGFRIVGRSARDEAGRPFPLVHMSE